MEEKSKEIKMGKSSSQKNEKLTYEQLEQMAGNLNMQCRQLYQQLNEARTAIAEFNEIEMLLSIIEKGEYFDSSFIDRCAKTVQEIVMKALDNAEKAAEDSQEQN